MTYEYMCMTCWHEFTMAISLPRAAGKVSGLQNKKITVRCPKCKSTHTQKLISYPNVHYKGKGFYSTDKEKK